VNATRIALLWVDLYTRGAPEAVRVARRAEIASDVWEHHAAMGTGPRVGLAVLSRCARGAPADLSWRAAQRSTRPSTRGAARAAGLALGLLAYLLLVGVHGYSAAALVGLDLYGGGDWPDGELVRYAGISGALLALLLAGGVLLPRRPRVAIVLLLLGTLGGCIAFRWAVAVYGPAGAAVLVSAATLGLGRGRDRRQARA
jgi:hypothetical protein